MEAMAVGIKGSMSQRAGQRFYSVQNGLLYVRIEAGGKESVREAVSRHGQEGA